MEKKECREKERRDKKEGGGEERKRRENTFFVSFELQSTPAKSGET